MSSNRLIIFSKSADPQNVKTRLRPHLTGEQCLALHIALLKDTLRKVGSLSPVLYLAGSGRLPFDPGVEIRQQRGADLGERMRHAFTEQLTKFQNVVIIGTDAPTVPLQQILFAFQLLSRKEVVLGPCDDGGYYLIGMSKILSELFDNMDWGTGTVLQKSLEKLQVNQYALLETYFDVDVIADVIRLKTDLEKRSELDLPHLREWFREDYCESAR